MHAQIAVGPDVYAGHRVVAGSENRRAYEVPLRVAGGAGVPLTGLEGPG
jgi:hypothetical protein